MAKHNDDKKRSFIGFAHRRYRGPARSWLTLDGRADETGLDREGRSYGDQEG